MMEPTLFTKLGKSSDRRDTAKKPKFHSWGNTMQAANVIAWYINPAIYILFSVIYFVIGMTIG